MTVEVSREIRDEWVEEGILKEWDEENREVVGSILQNVLDNPVTLTREKWR